MPEFRADSFKEKLLLEKMHSLGIRKRDIIEGFVRSSGPGGSNANKTSTCVYLKHLPTGIEVKCQQERYQALNRLLARQLLVKKIEARRLKDELKTKWLLEKARRQARKRSKKAKLIVLEAKRLHSKKKSLRSKVRQTEIE